MMKLSLQTSLVPSFVIIAASLGLTASPVLSQLSALPPLHCNPECFIPRNGIAVTGLAIVPWNDPRATSFLTTLVTNVPPGSQRSQVIDTLGVSNIVQAVQARANDPALISSLGQILLILSSENPNLAALQQPEADFIAWLLANVNENQISPSVNEDQISPSVNENRISPSILETLFRSGSPSFLQAATEGLRTLSPQELAAIATSPQTLQAFANSLSPQTPASQASVSQQGQDLIYGYFQSHVQSRRMLQQTTLGNGPNEEIDLSGLNLPTLPTTEMMHPHWVAQAPVNGAVSEVLQSEVEAYQMAYAAADLFKAEGSVAEADVAQIAQDASIDSATVNRPWSAFISGDIAWGNTQSSTRFDLNNYAILAGADYAFNPNFLLGGAISYSTGSQRSSLATAEADSVAFSLYGTGQYGTGGYTTGFAGYGFDNFSSRRTIFIPAANREATGSTSGNQFNIGLETGWVFLEGGILIQPSLGIRHTNNRINGYTETGAGSLSTVIDSYNTNSTLGNLSLDLAYPILTGDRYILPFVGVGLNHRLGYSAPVVTARFVGGTTSFVVPVADLDSTWFDLSLGVSAELSRRTVGQIIFRTDLGRFDANINNLSVNLRHSF